MRSFTPLSFTAAEKFVTVQTKNKQNKQTNTVDSVFPHTTVLWKKSEIYSVENFGMKFDAKQALGCKIILFFLLYTRLLNTFCDTLPNIA